MNTIELRKMADRLRFTAVDMIYRGKDGHPGPALSIADIITVLYFVKRPCMSHMVRSIVGKRLFWLKGRGF